MSDRLIKVAKRDKATVEEIARRLANGEQKEVIGRMIRSRSIEEWLRVIPTVSADGELPLSDASNPAA